MDDLEGVRQAIATPCCHVRHSVCQCPERPGDSDALTATESLGNSIVWKSENPSIATVDVNGNVKAVSEGTTYIYATSSNYSYAKQKCAVTVTNESVMYVGGIYYTPIEGTTNSVRVTNLKLGQSEYYNDETDQTEYSATINVPSQITYDGKTYNVTEIGDYAFYRMADLQMVIVPASVTRIGNHAFEHSEKLAMVQFASSSKLKTIDYNAFRGCYKLFSVTVPNSVTDIEHSAFEDCTNLTTLKLSTALTTISPSLCRGCKVLDNVTVPSAVKVIGNNAFRQCAALKNITLPEQLSMIDEYAFAECQALPELVLPAKVASLQSNAFQGCTALKNVVLPATLEGIGADCFSDCKTLASVEFKNTKPISIGDGAFYNSNALNSVKITDLAAWTMTNFGTLYSNPTTLAKHLFMGDKELTDITVPANATYVNQFAFAGLESVTGINIPENVKVVSDFIAAGSPAKVTMADNVLSIASHSSADYDINYSRIVMAIGDEKTISTAGTYTSGNETVATVAKDGKITAKTTGMALITVKPADASMSEMKCLVYVTANPTAYVGNIFYDFSSEKSATVVDMVGKDGFVAYGNDRYDYSGIVSIPSTVTYAGKQYAVTEINANAFKNMKHLQKVIIPASVTTIGASAFENSENMARVEFAPDSKLTALKARAFNTAKKLDEVTLPNSLYTIEEATFQNCNSLKNITLPAKLTTMGENAFANCAELEKIDLPATLSAIQNYCFANNPKLNNVVIPVSMQGIGQYCFRNCTAMTDITFRNTGVMTVGDDAFAGCTALARTGIEKLDAWVMTNFSNAEANPLYFSKNLTQNGTAQTVVRIPSTAQYINQYAFVNCEKMTECYIPAAVQTVSDNIFLGCKSLVSVKCSGTTPAYFIGTGSLSDMSDVFNAATLYAPYSAVDAYKADSYWSHYAHIEGFNPCIPGDANGDGKVTMADANMVINVCLGSTPDYFDFEAADINNDGKITKEDADLIVRKYLE